MFPAQKWEDKYACSQKLQTLGMLRLALLLLAVLNVVFANFIPEDPDDLSIATELLPGSQANSADKTGDIISSTYQTNSEYAGCAPDASANNLISDDNQSINDMEIFRRQSRSCPAIIKKGSSILVAPRKRLRRPSPADPSKKKPAAGTDDRCTKPNFSALVTCTGPEVRFGPAIGFVVNCVTGAVPEITRPPQSPRIQTKYIARYCCSSFEDEAPAYIAYICDEKLDLDIFIPVWTPMQWAIEYETW